jgi:hypothetical protein
MNRKRVIWLVTVLAMVFAMQACKSDDDGGGGIGDNLKFTDEAVYNKDGSPYTGEKPFIVAGGTGLIKGGKMNFNIGVPSGLKPMDTLLSDMDTRYGHNVFSYGGYDTANTQAFDLVLANLTKKTLPALVLTSSEEIRYIYVDRDCTVTGKDIPPITVSGISVKVSNYTLKLKKGWNAVGMVLTPEVAGGTLSPTLVIGTGDSSNCKWVYE